jgi:hypothetical protein
LFFVRHGLGGVRLLHLLYGAGRRLQVGLGSRSRRSRH